MSQFHDDGGGATSGNKKKLKYRGAIRIIYIQASNPVQLGPKREKRFNCSRWPPDLISNEFKILTRAPKHSRSFANPNVPKKKKSKKEAIQISIIVILLLHHLP